MHRRKLDEPPAMRRAPPEVELGVLAAYRDKRETKKFRRLPRVLPNTGAVQKRRGQHAAMGLKRRESASC